MANARKMAVEALLRVEIDGAYSNIVLNEILNKYNPEISDRALATVLFYGVLDTKITLDYILKRMTGKSASKIKPFTLQVLRTALYQLLYTENIPQSAAVNEAVKLVKNSKEAYNSGFVNALLRNYLRQKISLPQDNSIFSLSVRYSCPEWILTELIKDYDLDITVEFLEHSLLPPPLVLRVNTIKNSAEQLSALLEQSGKTNKIINQNALEITEGGINTKNFEPYKNGLFFIQDLSSQAPPELISAKPNERILDMCAAPGGKSFSLALDMQNLGEVVSCDIHSNRVDLIKSGAGRLGIDIIKPVVCDSTIYNKELGLFDAVLCDVPCSGLGIIRRKPDIKYKKDNDFSVLEENQLKILNNAVNYLKSEGRIVYSTCTLRKAENENIVNKFLEQNKNFEVKNMKTYFPQNDGGEGFFCALLVKSKR